MVSVKVTDWPTEGEVFEEVRVSAPDALETVSVSGPAFAEL
jgi:hypothetical protein